MLFQSGHGDAAAFADHAVVISNLLGDLGFSHYPPITSLDVKSVHKNSVSKSFTEKLIGLIGLSTHLGHTHIVMWLDMGHEVFVVSAVDARVREQREAALDRMA